MKIENRMEQLFELVKKSPSPFHTAAAVMEELEKNGFTELKLSDEWGVQNGGKYYVNHHASTVIAFTVGSGFSFRQGFRIAAAHTDFPCFRIKGKPGILEESYQKINVETYGGAILNTWLDRPLSAAGRVALKGESAFRPKMKLVDFQKPLFIIPNQAIHINKEVNKGVELNKQTDMLPVAGISDENQEDTAFLEEYLAKELGVRKEELLDYELSLYNMDVPVLAGMKEEFISSPRLDNLTSVQALLKGITTADRKNGINVAAFFDHEEIGSKTKQGAGSAILSLILEKLLIGFGRTREKYISALAESVLLSVDVGHALHPNKKEKNDPTNKNALNSGLCVKAAASQSYATDSRGIAMIQQLCEENQIPYRKFYNRSDGTSGSTLGSIASSMLPVLTVEAGIPLLAMHSARELGGVRDQAALEELLTIFYSTEE